MAVNWQLAQLPENGFVDAINKGLEIGRQQAAQRNRDQMGQQLASGDYAGAQRAALAHNDFDYFDRVQQMAQSNRQLAAQHAETIARTAYGLKQIPVEQRPAAFEHVKPQLHALGITDPELQQVDLSDSGLNAYLGMALSIKEQTEMNKPIVAGLDQRVLAPDGKTVLTDAHPKLENVARTLPSGATINAPFNPYSGMYGRNAVEGAPTGEAPAAQPMPAAPQAAPGGDAGFGTAIAFTLHHEGGYAPHDANGAPVNFGINQSANPGVDVKHLTQDQARQIYYEKYWKPSGAANLPAVMQAPYFDTYVINPARAQQFLQQSGGDPQKFMELREAWQDRLVQSRPQQYGRYAHAWATRNADLKAGLAGADTGAPAQPVADDPYSFGPSSTDPASTAHVATPAEAKAMGFPEGTVVYVNAKGEPTVKANPTNEEPPLDPKTADFYAQRYLEDGTLPPMGMGKTAARNRQIVLTRAAELAGASGKSGADAAVAVTRYRNQAAALKQQETILAGVRTSEGTAIQNGEYALAESRKLRLQGNYPVWNAATQKYLRETGDPTIKAVDAYYQTFATEYGKVMTTTSGFGGGTLSDSARQEATHILNSNASLEQKASTMQALRNDMHARLTTMERNIEAGYRGLTHGGSHYGHPENSGSGSIPASAVQYLKQNPGLRDAFDAKYGRGAAARVLGGH